ncbi:hypothetical protein L873DRAFT_1810788 [Choiromyces venosus 120613-1]|uniref:Uncharacterized protein n=1 Tax=Choiromyces venosus 120613-1 TaxID=1336337 RepID=A0A3N4JES3_9PEZI|nr:hypothetical protein L873DRAFT_1810788 [Choiromyces venosus 120613-1]
MEKSVYVASVPKFLKELPAKVEEKRAALEKGVTEKWEGTKVNTINKGLDHPFPLALVVGPDDRARDWTEERKPVPILGKLLPDVCATKEVVAEKWPEEIIFPSYTSTASLCFKGKWSLKGVTRGMMLVTPKSGSSGSKDKSSPKEKKPR